MTILTLALSLGCPPSPTPDSSLEADTDTDTDADTDTDTDADTDSDTDTDPQGQTTAYLTTSDFSVGALAVVNLEDGTFDEPTDMAADASVHVEDGHVYVIGRLGFDYVRRYLPGSWDAPVSEFSVGTNPNDLEICDSKTFVSHYGETWIGIYDDDGTLTGTVDLSTYGDSDTIGPEASNLAEVAGTLYVVLQRLNRDGGWVTEGSKVVEIDCASESITGDWDVGGNAQLWQAPTGELYVTHEAWDTTPAGLSKLDPGGDGFTTVVEFTDGNPVGIAVSQDGTTGLMNITNSSYQYGVQCVDLGDGSTTEAEWLDYGYMVGIGGNDRDEAFMGGHYGAANGVVVYDIASCAQTSVIGTTLPGTSVVFD